MEESEALIGLQAAEPSASAHAALYISHFLSTWNSRLFEFAAVLFLAAIFPDTLLAVSVYAVTRGLAAILFAHAVGAYIDRGDRLQVVRVSILGQRAAVLVSCVVLERLLPAGVGSHVTHAHTLRSLFISRQLAHDHGHASIWSVPFVLALACAGIEKLCATMNRVAVERDWVVVLTANDEPARRHVNAQMRRIDLFCKLAGPLAIALVAAATTTRTAVIVVAVTSAVSVVAEYGCIALVYQRVPALADRVHRPTPERDARQGLWSSVTCYAGHPAFLPSAALAVLYLSVLSFSGTMVTFLLAAGYTPLAVGLARTASAVFELSATWLAPLLMARVGLVRAGLWSLSWQAVCVTAATSVFLGQPHSLVGATGLAAGVMLSRVGLWGFDLCAQNIVQDEVAAAERGAFSTAEAALQNLFEVLAFGTTVVFPRPEAFRWPVVVSVGAVYVAAALYTLFVRRRRGHLFHAVPVQQWLDKWRVR